MALYDQYPVEVFNSLGKKKEKFEPLNPPRVGLYVCGPTVYNEAHLGNLRSFLTFDIVSRYLEHLGYNVRYVRNITDVGHLVNDADEGEDKIEKRARLEQIEPMEIVQKYTNGFHAVNKVFNLKEPSIEPTATGHIVEQIEMVQKIIANGYDAEVIAALPELKPREDENFEIVHVGSFYDEGRDIKPIVNALEKHAVKTGKKIKLRLIGDIPDKNTITIINDIAKSITVSIEPPVKMQEALAIAKQADVLLLLQGDRFDRQIPTKVYEYLALNRPIWAVVGNLGETHKLLANFSANVVFSNYSNIAAIDNGVSAIFNLNVTPSNVITLSRQSQANKLAALIQNTI